jgi:hypothetical protein
MNAFGETHKLSAEEVAELAAEMTFNQAMTWSTNSVAKRDVSDDILSCEYVNSSSGTSGL